MSLLGSTKFTLLLRTDGAGTRMLIRVEKPTRTSAKLVA
jgi:hypothetical protein